MTSEEQLNEWVKGNSIHNHEIDECCPDFSCCQSRYKATAEERIVFLERPELRDKMLMLFLSAVMSGYGKDVHVAGSIEGHS